MASGLNRIRSCVGRGQGIPGAACWRGRGWRKVGDGTGHRTWSGGVQ